MEEQYQTIAKRLLSEIEEGRFAIGSALPTRAELAQRFKVARATMDRAVTLLVKRGVLASSRGSGTFVAAPGRDYQLALIGGSSLPLSKSLRERTKLKIERFSFGQLESKAARSALTRFDGLVWVCPEDLQRSWAAEFSGRLPQVVVNRDFKEFDFVSTDHRGAIRQISAERLAAWPDALPVFLCRQGAEGFVWGMREEGFVDACREAARFYEIFPLPRDFEAALEALRLRFKTPLAKPLILVSGSLGTTGATMAWARSSGLVWGKDILYSDFDNDYPLDVWGLAVTSFIQDFDMLVSEGIAGLLSLIDGHSSSVRKLVMPRRISGKT
jgi:DNA-binding transcriptional regulator YhcF (GntR family)